MPTYRKDLHTGHDVPLVETDDILKGAITTEKISDGTPKLSLTRPNDPNTTFDVVANSTMESSTIHVANVTCLLSNDSFSIIPILPEDYFSYASMIASVTALAASLTAACVAFSSACTALAAVTASSRAATDSSV